MQTDNHKQPTSHPMHTGMIGAANAPAYRPQIGPGGPLTDGRCDTAPGGAERAARHGLRRSAEAGETPRALRILVVDDRWIDRKLLRTSLVAEGHDVIEAADGIEALVVLGRHCVDAIIADSQMPGLNGLELCATVRQDPRLRDLPFIIYTATYDSATDRDAALRSGTDGYVVKPEPVETLVRAIEDTRRARRRATDGRTGIDAVSMVAEEGSRWLRQERADDFQAFADCPNVMATRNL